MAEVRTDPREDFPLSTGNPLIKRIEEIARILTNAQLPGGYTPFDLIMGTPPGMPGKSPHPGLLDFTPLFGLAGGVRGPPKMSWELAAKKIGEGLRGIVPDEEVVRKLNAIIGGRMQYGLRTEAAVEPSYRASWSNAGTEWVPGRGYGVYKKGQEVQLDANEILIPKSWVGNMKHFEESLRFADPLPLYKGSTEAWTRGQARPGDFLQFPNRGTGWPGLGPERELP